MKHVLKKPIIEIDGTDLTKRASQVNVDMPDDEVDTTSFGGDWKETERGMSDASMVFNFFQDYDASMTDAVLWPLKKEGEKFIAYVQALEGEPSATNPGYVMGGKLFGYSPIAGTVGEANTTETTVKNTTDLGVEKVTSLVEKEEKETAIEEAF